LTLHCQDQSSDLQAFKKVETNGGSEVEIEGKNFDVSGVIIFFLVVVVTLYPSIRYNMIP